MRLRAEQRLAQELSRRTNLKCKGPEVEVRLANAKAAQRLNGSGEDKGNVGSKGAGG